MRPIVVVKADEKLVDLSGTKLISLEIQDGIGDDSDTMTLNITDDGSMELPRRGVTLQVWIGYEESKLVDKGKYTVDEIDLAGPPNQMEIRARATDFSPTSPIKVPKQRSWHDTTIGAMVSTIASENKLVPAISASLASVPVPHRDQTESDIMMLADIAYQNKAICKTAGGKLVFVSQGEATSASGKSLGTKKITPSMVTNWRDTITDRSSCTGVRTHWHELEASQLHDELAGSDSGQVYDIVSPYPTQVEAIAAGKSKFAELQRGTAKLTINMPGDPELSAEMVLDLAGFRKSVDGEWAISNVTHNVAAGYTCTINGLPPL